jgi:hypothetical protein
LAVVAEELTPGQEDKKEELGPASDEVWLALADLLRKKELREALKKWIDAQADNISRDHSYKVQHLWLSYGFAVVIFGGIVMLAVFKIITPEVMVGLVGPMLGYWFGRKQSN